MKSTCFMLNLRNYQTSGWRALRTLHVISRTVFWKYFSNMCLVGLEFDKTSLFSKCFLCYFETTLCSGRCHVSLCACVLICGSLNQEWRIYKLSIKILVHGFEKMVIPGVYMEKNVIFWRHTPSVVWATGSGHKCLKNGKLSMSQTLIINQIFPV